MLSLSVFVAVFFVQAGRLRTATRPDVGRATLAGGSTREGGRAPKRGGHSAMFLSHKMHLCSGSLMV